MKLNVGEGFGVGVGVGSTPGDATIVGVTVGDGTIFSSTSIYGSGMGSSNTSSLDEGRFLTSIICPCCVCKPDGLLTDITASNSIISKIAEALIFFRLLDAIFNIYLLSDINSHAFSRQIFG